MVRVASRTFGHRLIEGDLDQAAVPGDCQLTNRWNFTFGRAVTKLCVTVFFRRGAMFRCDTPAP